MEKSGKAAGKAYADALNAALKNFGSGSGSGSGSSGQRQFGNNLTKQLTKRLNSYKYQYETGKYDALQNQMSAQLNRYAGEDSESLKAARAAEKEFNRVFAEIQKNFNTLDDGSLTALFNNLKQQADTFKNSMAGVRAEFEKLGKITGGSTSGKQLGQYKYNFETGKYKSLQSEMATQLGKYGSQDTDALNSARKAQAEYDRIFASIQKDFDSLDDSKLKTLFDELTREADKFKNAMSEVKTESTQAISPRDATIAHNEILTFLNNNTKAAKKYGDALRQLAKDAQMATTKGQLTEVNNQFKALKSQIQVEGLTGRSFFDDLSRGAAHIAEFVGVYRIINEGVQVFQKIVDEVTKVDAAMVELAKVSNASSYELTNSFEKATETAKKYGQSISEVVNSTADWSRLGYSLKDANQLADATALLQTVGDNMDQKSASEGLISTLQGFQLDASEAESIVDKFNEVANNYAIDTAGIASALQRSSASFKAAHTDLDKAIALITVGNEVVQDPERIGNMWKTVSARIRGAKIELEEAGEDTDGMVESTSKLRTLIKGATGFDIMADKAGTQFKDIYEIVLGIGKEWQNLSDTTQAGLLEKLAGKNQSNSLAAVLNNVSRLEEVYNSSVKSAGSAQKELENFQKGIEYHTGVMQATFQEFANTVMNSDFIISFVDAGTQALEVLTQIIDKVGLLQVALTGLTARKTLTTFVKGFKEFQTLQTTVSSLKTIGAQAGTMETFATALASAGKVGTGSIPVLVKELQKIPNLSDDFKVSILTQIDGIDDAAAKAALGLSSVADAGTKVGFSLAGIGTAIKGFALAHPFLLAATAATAFAAIIVGVKNSLDEIKMKQVDAAEEAGLAWQQEYEDTEQAIEKIKALREVLDDPNTSATQAYEAESELLEIQNSLTESYNGLAGAISLVTGNLDDQISKIRQASREEAKNQYFQNYAGYKEAENKWYGSYGNARSDENAIELTNKSVVAQTGMYGFGNQPVEKMVKDVLANNPNFKSVRAGNGTTERFQIEYSGDSTEAQEDIQALIDDFVELQSTINDENAYTKLEQIIADLGQSFEGAKEIEDRYGSPARIAQELKAVIDETTYTATSLVSNTKRGNTAKGWQEDYQEAINAYNEAVAEGNYPALKQAKETVDDYQHMIQTMINDTTTDFGKQYANMFTELGSQLDREGAHKLTFRGEHIYNKTSAGYKTFSNLRSMGVTDADLAAMLSSEYDGRRGQNVVQLDKAFIDQLKNAQKDESPVVTRIRDAITEANKKGLFSSDGKALKDINSAIQKFVSDTNIEVGGAASVGYDSVKDIVNLLTQEGFLLTETVDETGETVLATVDATGRGAVDGVSDAVDGVNGELDEAEAKAQSTAEKVNSALSTISKANTFASNTGKTLDTSFFDDADMKEYASALEYVNGTIQLNTKKVKELNKAKAEEQIAFNNAAKTADISAYAKNEKRIKELSAELKTLSVNSSDYSKVRKELLGLLEENENYSEHAAQLDLYTKSLREATGAYQAWLDTQNAPESGDMASDVENAMQAIKDTFDPESEQYQKWGTNKYTAALDFVVPDEVSSEGQDAVQSYVKNLGTYFDGVSGRDKFIQEAIDKQLMDYDPDTGAVDIAAGKTMKDFSKAFNWTDETMQAMFGVLEDYFGHDAFSWADEGVIGLTQLSDAFKGVEQMAQANNLKLSLDYTSCTTAKDALDAVEADMNELGKHMLTLEADSEDYEEALTVMTVLAQKKAELSSPVLMSVDTSQITDGQVANAITLLQQFKSQQAEVSMQASLGMDTSSAQTGLDSIVSEINGLSPEVKATIGISEDAGVAEIESAIEDLTPEVLATLGVNDDAIKEYDPDIDGVVKYKADVSGVNVNSVKTQDGKINYVANTSGVYLPYDLLHKQGTITYRTVTVKSTSNPANGYDTLNGTAHASGTAKLSGDWGNKHPGKTLVGEVGRELIVINGAYMW